MRRIFYPSVLFTILFFYSACQKEETLRRYTIMNPECESGIANAYVRLYERVAGGTVDFDLLSLLEETYTDVAGDFEFNTSLSGSDSRYTILVSADGYADTFHDHFPAVSDYKLDHEGYLRIHVYKSDTTEFEIFSFRNPFSGKRFRTGGTHIDFTFTDVFRAGDTTSLQWIETKSGEQIKRTGMPVYVPPKDTANYEILLL